MKEKLIRPLIMIVLVALVITAYADIWNHQFLKFDDPDTLTSNPIAMGGLSWNGVVWAFTSLNKANWFPLTRLSHLAMATLFGTKPGPHLFLNVLLHAANACLLFEALRRLTGSFWRSAAVGILFAIHPQHVESVAWLTERKDVLFMFFGLLALNSYARYARKPSLVRYILVLVFFALGLMSKPMLVSLPILLLLLDVWPLGRIRELESQSGPASLNTGEIETGVPKVSLRKAVLEKLPLGLLCLVSCMITMAAQHSGGAVKDLEYFSFSVRIANSMHSFMFYAWKTFYPVNMAIFAPLPPQGYPMEIILASWAFLIFATLGALITWKSWKFIAVGWAWYLISLLPVIGLVQVGNQAHADRYAYLPCIGLYIAIVWSVGAVIERMGRAPALHPVAVCSGVFLFFGATTALYCITLKDVAYWKDERTLFSRDLEIYPQNTLALTLLGDEEKDHNNLAAAADYYLRAIDVGPDKSAYEKLAGVLIATGKYKEATEVLQALVRMDPTDYTYLYDLGKCLVLTGHPQDGIFYFNLAVSVSPQIPDTYPARGQAYLLMGKFDAAEQDYQSALRLRPNWVLATGKLAEVYTKTGRTGLAIGILERALAITPDSKDLRADLEKARALESSPPKAPPDGQSNPAATSPSHP